MIERVLPLQFIKKTPLYGSYKGMRYRLASKDGALEACVYPEPYAFDAVPDEQKTYRGFELSDEGYEAALGWLNSEWDEKYSR